MGLEKMIMDAYEIAYQETVSALLIFSKKF